METYAYTSMWRILLTKSSRLTWGHQNLLHTLNFFKLKESLSRALSPFNTSLQSLTICEKSIVASLGPLGKAEEVKFPTRNLEREANYCNPCYISKNSVD